MPFFGKNSNANSENRRRRRAQLLLNNKNLTKFLKHAFHNNNSLYRKYYTQLAIRKVKESPNKWTPNLVPRFDMMLMQKLRKAFNNIQNNLKKIEEQENIARRQARQANYKRIANKQAAFLLTNEGKQWKRKNNEARRIQKQRNSTANNRSFNASGYRVNESFTYR